MKIIKDTYLPCFNGFYETNYIDDDCENVLYGLFNDPDKLPIEIQEFFGQNVWEFIDYATWYQDAAKLHAEERPDGRGDDRHEDQDPHPDRRPGAGVAGAAAPVGRHDPVRRRRGPNPFAADGRRPPLHRLSWRGEQPALRHAIQRRTAARDAEDHADPEVLRLLRQPEQRVVKEDGEGEEHEDHDRPAPGPERAGPAVAAQPRLGVDPRPLQPEGKWKLQASPFGCTWKLSPV